MATQDNGAWILLELSEEQQRLVRQMTGKEAAMLTLRLSEFASGRFFIRAGARREDEGAPGDV